LGWAHQILGLNLEMEQSDHQHEIPTFSYFLGQKLTGKF
jgi:hypothetical protein